MSLQLDRPLVVLDLETTGANVSADRIVELCTLKVTPDGEETIFQTRVNPCIPISQEASDLHNIKNEEVLKALLRLLLNSKQYSISKLYNTLKSLNYEIGKTTIQKYLGYIEDSYFMFSVPIFSYKIKDQLQYPRKNYFIDNSFINSISTKFSKNLGRLYENVVAVSLLKKFGDDIFYWESDKKEEVDFVIKNNMKVSQLIQVCYDISEPETKKREIRALLKASKELKCKNLLVITSDYESEKIEEWFGIKRKIKFIPLWKWLLEEKALNN